MGSADRSGFRVGRPPLSLKGGRGGRCQGIASPFAALCRGNLLFLQDFLNRKKKGTESYSQVRSLHDKMRKKEEPRKGAK
jgi:hypothetical protein